MVTKVKKASSSSDSAKTSPAGSSGSGGMPGLGGFALPSGIKGSAQQIWQAGLGAFAKAQAEGTKALEALVKESTNLQRKTQSAAEEKISEATSRMTAMAGDITSKATGQWDKLENIFEERVAKALNKLGVPSAKDVNALIARIDELNASVQKLSPKPEKSAKTPIKPAESATKSAAKKSAPKRTAKAVAKGA